MISEKEKEKDKKTQAPGEFEELYHTLNNYKETKYYAFLHALALVLVLVIILVAAYFDVNYGKI